MCGIYVNMTLEDLVGCKLTEKKMENVSQALEELLVAAQRQDCLTVGVYESAKLMNVDPDSVVLCVLAADEEDEDDIALQIHFTLIQAFCCDIDINILRVSGMRRLAQVLGEQDTVDSNGNEPKDLHCILVTSPHVDDFKSQALKEVTRPTSPTERYCDGSCRGSQSDGAGMMERDGKAVGLRGQSGLDFHRQPDERICAMSDWTGLRQESFERGRLAAAQSEGARGRSEKAVVGGSWRFRYGHGVGG
ncbi:hypothetical protein GJAV_G00110660 [Gymnothorax javanicus]|nr:hypothetical protein GJAV_G00110660 [Gymnothorax javanicus]